MLISRLSQYMNDNIQNHLVLIMGQDYGNGDGENATRVGGNTNQVRGNANPVGGNNQHSRRKIPMRLHLLMAGGTCRSMETVQCFVVWKTPSSPESGADCPGMHYELFEAPHVIKPIEAQIKRYTVLLNQY